MNTRVTYRDLPPINDKVYRISKMDPRLACWLFTTLSSKVEGEGQLVSALGMCSKEEFLNISSEVFNYIKFIDIRDGNEFPTVLLLNGKWASTELEDDPSLVFKLLNETIMFNISSFLAVKE